jgi:hypothetical protein
MPTATKTKKATTKQTAKAKVASKSKNKTNYLTTRILEQAANTGFAKAAEQTMKVMGYNVIVQGDWVVKKHQDGTIEKISMLEKSKTKTKLVFD